MSQLGLDRARTVEDRWQMRQDSLQSYDTCVCSSQITTLHHTTWWDAPSQSPTSDQLKRRTTI